MKKAELLKKRYEALKSDRLNWDSHWDEVSQYVIPNKDDVYKDRNSGEKKGQKLYDTTAAHSNTLLASALHGMLTNPSLIWFGMAHRNAEVNKIDRVRKWLQDATNRMHTVMNDSNFQPQIHELYVDMGAFGTGVMFINEDDTDIVRFTSIPVFRTYLREGNKGVVDTVYRDFEWDVKRIVQEFGLESLPADLQRDLKNNVLLENKKFEITHMVEPRIGYLKDNRYGIKTPKGLPFASHYMIHSLGHELSEGGFHEFPYVCPRWSKTTFETYGRSPGMNSLPDNKMVNEMMKVTIRSAQKTIDPPLNVPDDGAFRPVRMTPGGLNYYRAGTPDRVEPIMTNPRVDFGQFMLNDIRTRIRQAFFIDQLQLREGPEMTATEVRQRTEEQLRLLGPILGRQHNELLKPLIDRVFGIMLRNGEFDAPPPELADADLKVNYVSQIAKAQKASEADNLLRVLQSVMPIVEADPSVMDNIDGDAALRYSADLFNLPQEVLRSVNDRRKMRESRAQAQQQQMQQQQQLTDAETVNKMSSVMQ